MKPVFLRTAYNYDMNAASDETALHCPEPSLAQQSAAEECDINTIVRRFGLTGQLPENASTPVFGDFSEAVDYHGFSNVIRRADEAFMTLPADVRYRFHNDPQELLEFVGDSRNLDEARKLGLTRTLEGAPLNPATVAPVSVPAVSPAVPISST